MDRVYVELGTPFGRPGSVIRYGHFGREPKELMREVEAWIEAEMRRLDPDAYL